MITRFSHNSIEELKYYVYVYSDPDTKKPFYIEKNVVKKRKKGR